MEEVLERAAAAGRRVPGEAAFKLYDTYGLPRDFIEDMIEERKLTLDVEGFERALEGQREKARAGSGFRSATGDLVFVTRGGLDKEFEASGDAGVFVGYETIHVDTTVWAVFDADSEQAAAFDAMDARWLERILTRFRDIGKAE